ncbi:PilW family protein [Rubrivivax sp. A210]|uniref:PilW family protein n=1 Tax=Rubrivivax sp. A210 TaxID=2772301 RepID=UPI00191A8BB4|nr:prepilin-type N-terminal cleavage/methylation domain-containing protein [Rubrivivax sp. A210]
MRGFSLVELMVGIAVGMFVVAAASLMATSQLTDNRRLLLETQLQQDLRASADIIARELRRSGYWATARAGVPPPGGGTIGVNPYTPLTPDAANSKVSYNYRRGSGAESFGFRLSNGTLQSCQSDYDTGGCSAGWQDLTDRATIRILDNGFSIATVRSSDRAQAANGNAIIIPCPQLCGDGTTACWPRVSVRELVITITGESVTDSSVRRTLELSVRPRNDRIELSNEAGSGQACPG